MVYRMESTDGTDTARAQGQLAIGGLPVFAANGLPLKWALIKLNDRPYHRFPAGVGVWMGTAWFLCSAESDYLLWRHSLHRGGPDGHWGAGLRCAHGSQNWAGPRLVPVFNLRSPLIADVAAPSILQVGHTVEEVSVAESMDEHSNGHGILPPGEAFLRACGENRARYSSCRRGRVGVARYCAFVTPSSFVMGSVVGATRFELLERDDRPLDREMAAPGNAVWRGCERRDPYDVRPNRDNDCGSNSSELV